MELPDHEFYSGVNLRQKKDHLAVLSLDGNRVTLFRRGHSWYIRRSTGRRSQGNKAVYKTLSTGAETFYGALDGAVCFLRNARVQ